MSYVQAAEYNAVTAISGRYTPRVDADRPAGASPRAAVAAAAYTTLAYYFPTLAPSLVSTYTDYLNVTLAKLPEKAKLAGIAVGAAAASQLIASRFGDGRNAPRNRRSVWRRSRPGRGCSPRRLRRSRRRHRGRPR